MSAQFMTFMTTECDTDVKYEFLGGGGVTFSPGELWEELLQRNAGDLLGKQILITEGLVQAEYNIKRFEI